MNKKAIDSGYIRQNILDLGERKEKITLDEWKNSSMNNYERNYLYEFVDDETLAHICSVFLSNFTQYIPTPTTYEEIVLVKIFPELLTRFKESLTKAQ